jgi:hypothetical protein
MLQMRSVTLYHRFYMRMCSLGLFFQILLHVAVMALDMNGRRYLLTRLGW